MGTWNSRGLRGSYLEELINLTGYKVTVHYKEYKGSLPWRGYERAIVDKVTVERDVPDTTPQEDPFFL